MQISAALFQKTLRNLLMLLLFVAGLTQAALPPAPALDIHELSQMLLREPAQYLMTNPDTPLAQLPAADFQPLTGQAVNQGISDQAYWIRVRLNNPGEQPRHWVMNHATSYLDTLTAYVSDAGAAPQRIHLSDRQPFATRPLVYRKLAFSHTTPAGSYTDVYLRLAYEKPDSMILNVELSEADTFRENARREYAGYGLYFGALLTLIAVALIGACLLRRRIYFDYALFLLFSALMWALLDGLAYQFLWSDSVFWHNEGFHILYLLVAASAFQFSRGFLNTRLHFPRTDRLIRVMQCLMLAGIGLRLAGYYVEVLALGMLALASLTGLSLLGLMAYRKGITYARWYALAWLIYGLGIAINVACATSTLLPWGMEALLFAQLSALVEATLLLVALGERLLGWDRDRRRALQMAHQDPLTGLSNRRVMTRAFASFKDLFERNEQPVFLLMIDLDHFKQINDQFGHEAGDEVLKHAARLMRHATRSEDICIRYGGEEFAILLQADSIEGALGTAERIRRDYASTPTRYKGHLIEHTLSAGLCPVYTGDRSLSQAQALLFADKALYAAKTAGRNRCEINMSTATTPHSSQPETA